MPTRRRFLSISAKAAAAPLLVLAGCQANQGPSSPTPAAPTNTPLPPPTQTPMNTSTPIPPSPTPLPTVAIAIDPSDIRQTLREVGGGNFIHYFGGVTTALEPISTLNLETLDPQVVRVRIDLDEWQPAEDGEFQTGVHVKGTFEFMQELKKRSPGVKIVASVWEVPDWMVRNPEAERSRIIKPEYEEKVMASIGAWLLRARDEYGVEVDYFSFNEANIGVNVSLTPGEQIAMIRQGGPQLEQMGLKTRFLLGDTSNIASFVSYTPRIYEAEDIRPYLGPLAFHSWDFNVPNELLRRIGQFAVENNLEVWCTEAGWDPAQWNYPSEFPTWKHALRLANIYTRVLRDSRTTTMLYWEMMGRDYFINDGEKPFPALVFLDQLKRHFPAGAQIVATPDDEAATFTILSLAAITPGGGFSVQLLSQIKPARTAALTGLPDGTYTVTRITEDGGLQTLDPLVVTGGEARIDLPGMSFTFLKMEP